MGFLIIKLSCYSARGRGLARFSRFKLNQIRIYFAEHYASPGSIEISRLKNSNKMRALCQPQSIICSIKWQKRRSKDKYLTHSLPFYLHNYKFASDIIYRSTRHIHYDDFWLVVVIYGCFPLGRYMKIKQSKNRSFE